ncbi:holin family protein [Acidimangrovimonas pyrenivorans]|uniref:Holin family protein n=1 Tax=Acidimangrovimonas pyrenivorans TaxID=2030798 RepID=A0ABV7AD65_9RHOB
MGLISRLFGGPAATAALGNAITGVAETFTPSATKRMELSQQAYLAAQQEAGAEFASPGAGGFDRFVNGLNRLPRPLLAFGTLGLFVDAMVDPAGFATRMTGLAAVPQPLWWLLGAIVSFYFGAREAHYFRLDRSARPGVPASAASRPVAEDEPNAALDNWRNDQGR